MPTKMIICEARRLMIQLALLVLLGQLL